MKALVASDDSLKKEDKDISEAERIKKMDQAAKAFSERDKRCHDLAQYDEVYADYEKNIMKKTPSAVSL